MSEALALADIAPSAPTDLPILAGSLLLYLCGRCGHFVRELIVGLADEVSSKATGYAGLPESLRVELFAGTLEVAKSPERYGYSYADAEQLISSLAEYLNAKDGALSIRSEILAIAEADMHSRTLAALFKRVELAEIWRELGKQAPLKSFLSKGSDGECLAEATTRLDRVMKDRNRLAHPTSTTTFPDPDQVLEICSFFRVLAQVVVDVARLPR